MCLQECKTFAAQRCNLESTIDSLHEKIKVQTNETKQLQKGACHYNRTRLICVKKADPMSPVQSSMGKLIILLMPKNK